jgi:deoxyribodipyrimidine photolyase-related protein
MLETSNFFNHKNKIGKVFYLATTDIPPIDDLIKKVITFGYCHHIERLMYLGNFMLLCLINPQEVFRWFSELFIDAIGPDWVMMPNIYGMSQYSSTFMMKKPYFSSSNYIDKMSCYKRKEGIYKKIELQNQLYEWYEIWDALYYNFIDIHQDKLKKIYSVANSVSNLKKKENREELFKIAKLYIKKYINL